MTNDNADFTQSFDGAQTEVFNPLNDGGDPIEDFGKESIALKKKRMVWPWVVLASVLVALAAACAGGIWFFQSHALPGVELWGHSMTGKSKQQIASLIDDQVNNTEVPVTYEGKTDSFTLKDLGISIDAESIADKVMDAKRDAAWYQRYLPWENNNVVTTSVADTADSNAIDTKLGISNQQPAVDAQVNLNADQNGFDVVPMTLGQGADAQPVAEEAERVVQSLGTEQPKTVTVTLKETKPVITDDVANAAKATLDSLIAANIQITIGDHGIATFDAPALAASMTINANQEAPLNDGETRNGYVVFSAEKLQQYYNDSMKPNLKTDREDRDVIVNGDGEEIGVNAEGHDGVTVADGADTNIGTDAAAVLAKGSGSIKVEGKVDPMQTKTTKRHVVVDLSDHHVYAYENDQLVKSMWMSAGEGNDPVTGECMGDLCTGVGDYKIWLKYESQDMSGNLTLSDGSVSTWDVKDVGYVNYFSQSGCAIHRIATSSYYGDANLAATGGGNTSHGCVGIGWDVAPWFYDWCKMGTTVHVQL